MFVVAVRIEATHIKSVQWPADLTKVDEKVPWASEIMGKQAGSDRKHLHETTWGTWKFLEHIMEFMGYRIKI